MFMHGILQGLEIFLLRVVTEHQFGASARRRGSPLRFHHNTCNRPLAHRPHEHRNTCDAPKMAGSAMASSLRAVSSAFIELAQAGPGTGR